uniref:Uncharacterized protein n=1 Tax=Lepeophtheirus salmonis TaxID=72036 RepID=A0A0K2V761_LEPSM
MSEHLICSVFSQSFCFDECNPSNYLINNIRKSIERIRNKSQK